VLRLPPATERRGLIVELPVSLPPFFAEACGYRGSARYLAVRWIEGASELWLSDDGHVARGRSGAMATLWRREFGDAALEHYRSEARASEKPPWLLFDRERHSVSIGCALSVWRVIEGQRGGEIIRSG
jgi:hypothetical protein